MLVLKAKGQPCEQGERADKTGCIPASGPVSKLPKLAAKPAAKPAADAGFAIKAPGEILIENGFPKAVGLPELTAADTAEVAKAAEKLIPARNHFEATWTHRHAAIRLTILENAKKNGISLDLVVDLLNSITQKEWVDIQDYVTHSKEFNYALRHGDESKLEYYGVEQMQKAFAKLPKIKATVYRGVYVPNWNKEQQEQIASVKVGDVLTDKGFSSQTTSEQVATIFASTNDPLHDDSEWSNQLHKKRSVVYVLQSKTSRGTYLLGKGRNMQYREVTAMPNTKYRVTNVERGKFGTRIHAEEI